MGRSDLNKSLTDAELENRRRKLESKAKKHAAQAGSSAILTGVGVLVCTPICLYSVPKLIGHTVAGVKMNKKKKKVIAELERRQSEGPGIDAVVSSPNIYEGYGGHEYYDNNPRLYDSRPGIKYANSNPNIHRNVRKQLPQDNDYRNSGDVLMPQPHPYQPAPVPTSSSSGEINYYAKYANVQKALPPSPLSISSDADNYQKPLPPPPPV